MTPADVPVYFVTGIRGLQAFSTEVVSRELGRALESAGHRLEYVELKPPSQDSSLWRRWAREVWYRYVAFPRHCARTVKPGAVVYITDHANAGVVRSLPPGCKVAVHVHDLTSLRPPWDFPYRLRARNLLIWALGYFTKRPGVSGAQRLVAISDFTASELRRYLGIPAARIAVAYNGIDHKTFHAADRSAHPAVAGRLLTVGPDTLRKNYAVVAQAVTALRGRGTPVSWRHIGALDAGAVDKLRRHDALDVLSQPHGHVGDDALRAEYQQAQVLVHASHYEGFGLPPVEALACGTRVLASDIPASREVLGDHAHFFRPGDSSELAALLERFLNDPGNDEEVAVRVAHARRYDWSASADTIGTVVDSLRKQT